MQPGRAYSDYLVQRETLREQQRRDYAAFAAERSRQKGVIAELRTHGSHNYSHVRSREKAFAKLAEVAAPPPERRAISVALRAARRATGGPAVDVKGLTKAYDRTLFADVTAHFVRGDRIAIVGPNGAGKSTFLRILAGEQQPDRGSVRYGTGLRTASYAQTTVDDLPSGATAAEAVQQMGVTAEEARSLLGRLNLGGDAVDKAVDAFSGGERRRIMLARLMAQRADCLFLDEPTNDLDIPSREALEDVLASYDGALFVVSHDRYLLKRLAERVVTIRDGAATVVDADYATYEQRMHQQKQGDGPGRDAARAKPATPARPSGHEAKLELGRRRRALEEAEKRVAELDREKGELERLFAAPGLYDDPEEIARLGRRMDAVNAESEAAMEAWEVATEALEGWGGALESAP